MRGILFTGGEGPGPEECLRLEMEAGKERLIVTADAGLLRAEAAGIRPDWILGDMDSLEDPLRLAKYPQERVLQYPREKGYTDTELALKLLWEQGCGEVWIIGGGGGRGDHFLGIHALFERDRSPDRWITAGEDMYCLREGTEFIRTVFPGSLVSVFPLGSGPWEAASRSLKWPLEGLPWTRGFFGLSNMTLEENFAIHVIRGRFLVILNNAEIV